MLIGLIKTTYNWSFVFDGQNVGAYHQLGKGGKQRFFCNNRVFVYTTHAFLRSGKSYQKTGFSTGCTLPARCDQCQEPFWLPVPTEENNNESEMWNPKAWALPGRVYSLLLWWLFMDVSATKISSMFANHSESYRSGTLLKLPPHSLSPTGHCPFFTWCEPIKWAVDSDSPYLRVGGAASVWYRKSKGTIMDWI